MRESFWALGLMSGTSLDGIDAALIKSDGERIIETGPSLTLPYEEDFRKKLRALLGQSTWPSEIEHELTKLHAEAIEMLKEKSKGISTRLIGFHGQTIHHDPSRKITIQIGKGDLLARLTGIDVVNDFRSADVMEGGQGAPLVPIYHAALAQTLPKPLAILNIGGVANVTWIGEGDELLAFDTGPGNAMIDDWVNRHTGKSYDTNGSIASRGKIDEALLASYLSHSYFDRPAPKSLDRNQWKLPDGNLTLEDGAATLSAFSVAAIEMAQDWFPQPVNRYLVAGGGRHNHFIMELLQDRLGVSVEPVEKMGWDGDALEAQAFGFLAIRSFYKLPLSFPGTTGVPRAMSGGQLHLAS